MLTLGADTCDCPCCTRRRSARHRRHAWLGVIPLALAAIATAPLWRPPAARAVRRARASHWRRRAAEAALPADLVVYDEDPAAVADLLRRPDWTGPVGAPGGPRAAWRRLRAPERLRELSPGELMIPRDAPLLFLHRRQWGDVSGGASRDGVLVSVVYVNPAVHVGLSLAGGHAVSVRPNPQARHRVEAVLPNAHQPTLVVMFHDEQPSAPARSAPAASAAARVVRFPLFDAVDPGVAAAPVRFFAGQPDPADPRRFTIDFQTAGRRGRMTFTLGRPGVVARHMDYALA